MAFGRYGFDVVLFGVSLRPQPPYVEEEDEEYSDSNYEGDDQEHFETDDSEDDVPAGYGYGGGGGGGFGGAGLPSLWSHAEHPARVRLQGSLVGSDAMRLARLPTAYF